MKIYIIQRAWVDSLENHRAYAFGYCPIGFVESREEAERIVSEGGEAPQCWATPRDAKMFNYIELPGFHERDTQYD